MRTKAIRARELSAGMKLVIDEGVFRICETQHNGNGVTAYLMTRSAKRIKKRYGLNKHLVIKR